MTLATLSDVLQPALHEGYAVGGLVTLGWEDMRAYTEAAESIGVPLILQAGPSCREHTPLPILGKMFQYLAENVETPVVAHLDHGYSFEDCKIALDCGFTSLMFDGSRKSLQQNIDETAAVVEMAHAHDISCEGEIGFVGYANGEHSKGTKPEEAEIFARDSGVDAMAISCGNLHLQENKSVGLNIQQIRDIEFRTNIPLVIHGGSGVPLEQRKMLAETSNICKFNIGTELRMVFGQALRSAINADKLQFDRNQILKETINPIRNAAIDVLINLGIPEAKQV
jgi:fructose-bisphosphate aldolase class II